MNIIGVIVLVLIGLLLVGIIFKLAKFALKLVSLVLLFVFIIWIGMFIYDSSLEESSNRLYVIELNDSFVAYALLDGNYTFENLTSDDAKTVFAQYDKIYLVSYDTLKTSCVGNETSLLQCVREVSMDTIWTEYDYE